MVYKKKPILGTIIKIFILVAVVGFIVACYKVDKLRNNKYIGAAINKVDEIINIATKKASGSFAALVENYEPDEEDETIYEVSDSQNRYYYNQLDENAKIIYAEILNNIDKIKNGEDNIKISSKLAALAEQNNMNQALMVTFQNAWDAFRNDNVDYFYIDGTKMCLVTKTIKRGSKVKYEFYISKGQNKNYYIDSFLTKAQVENAEQYIKEKENEIINGITEKNDYYKILNVHNWIVDNLEYDINALNSANIYGALHDKRVVCEGYARVFKSIMDKMNIPCIFVSGVGISDGKSEDHAWNYVFLKGQWYAVDVTWDDPIIKGSGTISPDIKYKYFLKGSRNLEGNHVEDGKLADNGMLFKYPELSSDDYISGEGR